MIHTISLGKKNILLCILLFLMVICVGKNTHAEEVSKASTQTVSRGNAIEQQKKETTGKEIQKTIPKSPVGTSATTEKGVSKEKEQKESFAVKNRTPISVPSGKIAKVGKYDVYGVYEINAKKVNVKEYLYMPNTGQETVDPSAKIAKIKGYDVYGAYEVGAKRVKEYIYMPNTGQGTVSPWQEITAMT